MRVVLFFSFVFSSLFGIAAHPDLVMLRELYEKASSDEESNQKLYDLTKSYSLQTYPIYYAYNAAAEMSLANHTYWPDTKFAYFNAGKERLEKAIAAFPKIVELRYIRYCVQQGCPFFLGYDANLDEDKAYILANMNQTDWSDAYKKEVKVFLNDSNG